ncbi:Xpo1-domain-containing protein [Piedraia hortae CBS 480.64]|uniref:Exportin-T n=1 Tax=Piedraia hortae CBS 480.64 TaxID=1314780 RepID=A0A6A7BV01_9PEZI|nr:Xpo1-domain-containing protein [Piedraia hortae CBS 480.64]
MDSQVEQAIEISFDPRSNQQIKAQAYDFLTRLREDASASQLCLELFTRTPPPSEVVRLVSMEMVNNAVQTQHLDLQSLLYVKENLMRYVRQQYTPGATNFDSAPIQNKLTQTLTYLFTFLYPSEWSSFFDDFRSIAAGSGEMGTENPAATVLFLRILSSIHDEIADVMISRTPDEQKRSTALKDEIRARDVTKVRVSWQEILSRWRQMDLSITELCLRTLAKWVDWVDVNVVLNDRVQMALLELAGQQGNFSSDSNEARIRDAAIDTFTETVGKKMPPGDKLELIRFLNLRHIVTQLVASPALAAGDTPDYDTDLAETVAKLVNTVVFVLVKIIEGSNGATKAQAEQLLQEFLPHLLRFFSDEFDEVCSTVIPSTTDLLTMLRRNVSGKHASSSQYTPMLQPILNAIIAKMKYDESVSWGEEDSTDEADFQELRKRLYVLQQTVAAVDEQLYIDTVTRTVMSTLSRLSTVRISWHDIDLALYEMYLFGELAVKSGGLYNKNVPSTPPVDRLIEMMRLMVDGDLVQYPHPAVQLQYMEICVRYVQFFEHNTASIPKVLESFVNFAHSDNTRVRLRAWYLFQRFVRHLRAQLGNVAQMVVGAVADLLVIKAEAPDTSDDDLVSSEENVQSVDATLNSQLSLFEAVGLVASTQSVPDETQVTIANSVIEPLKEDMHKHLPAATRNDPSAVLQVHHIIMAFGSLANGSSVWAPGAKSGRPPPTAVSEAFLGASEATLYALEALQTSSDIRQAARHAFSRFLGVLGSQVLPQLPRWIEGLLSSASSNDEMAMFLRTLGQVVHGFKMDIAGIMGQMLPHLLSRVFSGMAHPATGTDDEIQLKELRQQYVNFILLLLNNDLQAVLFSPSNGPLLQGIVDSLKCFACDTSDPQSARLSFSALIRMVKVWGGDDIDLHAMPTSTNDGFDQFVVSQVASLPWALINGSGFNPNDAQMRSVLQEAANLQWTILRKMGALYGEQLQRELRSLGADDASVQRYLTEISAAAPAFRKFFVTFIQSAKR